MSTPAASTEPAAAAAPTPSARPTKPDETTYKASLATAQKTHEETMSKLREIKAKIDVATGNKDTSPTAKRRQELYAQAKEIRQKQGGNKDARQGKMEQVKKLDEQMRARMTDQKASRGKLEFKSEEELDAEITRLDGMVNAGTMKLVDEKKALENISRYRRLKKNFGQLAAQQKEIDEFKTKIADIKATMNNPEHKSLSEQYDKVQAEIDELKAEQDTAFKSINQLRDERTRLNNLQREQFEAMRKIKDDFFNQRRAYKVHEDEVWAQRRQRKKDEDAKFEREKKMARAKEILEEASGPAFMEEIQRAENLWHFFDPTHEVEKKSTLIADSGMRATAQRAVDDKAFKGMKVVKKDDEEDYFAPAKKGKKGKKSAAAAPAAGKYICPQGIVDDCVFLGVPVPATRSDIPHSIEKIQTKLALWRETQETETKKNVDKAKNQIDALEKAEEKAAANGQKAAVAEVTEKVKETKITDEAAASS